MSLKPNIKGILLIIGAALNFSVMAALVKSIPHINSSTTVTLRFIIGLVILGGLAFTGRIKLRFVNYPILFLRGLTGGLSVFIFYYSIIHLGIGKASVYIYAYPIFASIFSLIILKEKISGIKWTLIIIAFSGICLLSIDNLKSGFFDVINYYELLALLGTILTGLAIVLVKKLHDTDNSYAIFFAMCFIGLLIYIYPASMVENNISLSDIIILLAIGLVAAIGQLLMTEGYKFTSVTTGSAMHFMIPVLNSTIGFIYFNETMSFKEILGSIIIIGCCILILFRFPFRRT